MNDIKNLLNASTPIFDPEDLTRQILYSRLRSWLLISYLETIGLEDIRRLVLDLSGQKVPGNRHRDAPEQIARMHCIHYEHLTPVNRREALRVSMFYVGLHDGNGPELLGAARWREVQQLIQAKIDGLVVNGNVVAATPKKQEPSQEALLVARQWSRNAVANQVIALVDAKAVFSMWEMKRVRDALNTLRLSQDLDVHEESARDAGLEALTNVPFDEMELLFHASLPAAILDALGLSDRTGPQVFGEHVWGKIRSRYEKGMGNAPYVKKTLQALQALENDAQDILPCDWEAPKQKPGSTFLSKFLRFVSGPFEVKR